MTDIAIHWSNQLLRGDWQLAPDGSLATGNDMETAVLLSLFSDRTALPGDSPPDGGAVRGWWSDAYFRFPLGSRLWLLWREKQLESVRRRVEEYARESLQWLVTCGAAKSAICNARWLQRGWIELDIVIVAPGGERRVWRYPLSWSGIVGAGR